MSRPPGKETIVIVTPGKEGTFGSQGPSTSRTVKNCAIVPAGSDEAGGTRATVITHLLVIAPKGTTLESNETVEARGKTWEIEGDAGQLIDRSGRERAVKFALVKATG
jgi:hypothetical protein